MGSSLSKREWKTLMRVDGAVRLANKYAAFFERNGNLWSFELISKTKAGYSLLRLPATFDEGATSVRDLSSLAVRAGETPKAEFREGEEDEGSQERERRPSVHVMWRMLDLKTFYKILQQMSGVANGILAHRYADVAPVLQGSADGFVEEDLDSMCQICYEEVVSDRCRDEKRRVFNLSCGHGPFCERCATMWASRSSHCPICRRDTMDNDDEWWELVSPPPSEEMIDAVHSIIDRCPPLDEAA